MTISKGLVGLLLCVAASLGLTGCRHGRVPALAPQEWPTPRRPIVHNVSDRGGGLIFGGSQGTSRAYLYNGDSWGVYGISPDGQSAACLTYDARRTRARWLTFFDVNGVPTSNIMLPPEPDDRLLTRDMRITSGGANVAIVRIRRIQYHEGPVLSTPLRSSEEVYHVDAKGGQIVSLHPRGTLDSVFFFRPGRFRDDLSRARGGRRNRDMALEPTCIPRARNVQSLL